MIQADLDNLENFLTRALKITDTIAQEIISENLNTAIELLDNRERLIGIITQFYERISLYPDLLKIEFSIRINRLNKYIEILTDQTILIEEMLIASKKEIQNGIAKVYKNKENLKGYNLNNLK